MPVTSKKQKHIYRVDSESAHSVGWKVMIKLPSGEMITRTFADSLGGGKTKTLETAIAWRDEQMAIHNIQDSLHSKRRRVGSYGGRKDNTTGLLGITTEVAKRKLGDILYWTISGIGPEGKKVRAKYSTKTHGECDAFRMACRKRYELAGELVQIAKETDWPCEPDVPITKRY